MPRRMRDMARRRMSRDRASRRGRDRGYDYDYNGPEYDFARGGRSQSSGGRDSARGRGGRDSGYIYYEPLDDYGYDMVRGRGRDRARGGDRARGRRDYGDYGDYARGRDRGYDGEYDGDYLEDEDLMEWSKELLDEVEEKDKPYFSKENMERKAKEMGIEFKEFTFPELYTTALMMYTDYNKTLRTANMDLYVRLAKDWLCDEDAEVQYGEKLAAYYESIVEGM